jgi:hypothetical protein
MTFSFHPEAESEFHEAIDYYEGCESGLGYDFSIEVFADIPAIGKIDIEMAPSLSGLFVKRMGKTDPQFSLLESGLPHFPSPLYFSGIRSN